MLLNGIPCGSHVTDVDIHNWLLTLLQRSLCNSDSNSDSGKISFNLYRDYKLYTKTEFQQNAWKSKGWFTI
jgi:hypothetical protein